MNAINRSGIPVVVTLLIMSLAQLMLGPTLAAATRQSASGVKAVEGLPAVFTPFPSVNYLPLAGTDEYEYLYATSQICSFNVTNAQNSIDGAFNNATASATGRWEGDAANWTFDTLEDSNLVPGNVTAEFRFYAGGYADDPFVIEAFDGTGWSILATFNGTAPPPLSLTTVSYNVTALFDNTAKLNSARLRFRGTGIPGIADAFTLYVDGVRLDVSGNPLLGALIQDHYRIGGDTDLSVMNWHGDVDEPPVILTLNNSFRIRLQVRNYGGQLVSWRPHLEWSVNDSSFFAVPTVSGPDPFFVADTIYYPDETTIPVSYFGCVEGEGLPQNGIAYDSQNPPSANITLGSGNYTEIEFNVRANGNAAYNGTYFFRLTNNGIPFNIYAVNASVKISDPHLVNDPTTDICAACHRIHVAASPFLIK